MNYDLESYMLLVFFDSKRCRCCIYIDVNDTVCIDISKRGEDCNKETRRHRKLLLPKLHGHISLDTLSLGKLQELTSESESLSISRDYVLEY